MELIVFNHIFSYTLLDRSAWHSFCIYNEAEKAIEAIGAKIKNLKELIALRQETIGSRRSLADHTETLASEMSIHYSTFD